MTDLSLLKWIAIDWGTSHMRLWLMSEDGQIIDRRHSNRGMSSLTRDEFGSHLEKVLADLVKDNKESIPVICCGMVGSRQGWLEAPYVSTPCLPPSLNLASKTVTNDFQVYILPGIKQLDTPDVMRGEETQIAGFLAKSDNFTGVVCLPGTHSKWVQINDGLVSKFTTFLSGELFDILSNKSVLRHSISNDNWASEHFISAVKDVINAPENFVSSLFSIRAANLLNGADTNSAYARLSGLIIGSELASARAFWQDTPINIIGENGISRAYTEALEFLGCSVKHLNAEHITLMGLRSAYKKLKDQTL